MLQLCIYTHADTLHSDFFPAHTCTLRGFVVNAAAAAASSSYWSHLALAPADWLRLLAAETVEAAAAAAVEGGRSNRSRSRSKNQTEGDDSGGGGGGGGDGGVQNRAKVPCSCSEWTQCTAVLAD